MELAPLAAIYAPAKRPAIAPLSATMLEGLALLQPGKYTPPEVCLVGRTIELLCEGFTSTRAGGAWGAAGDHAAV